MLQGSQSQIAVNLVQMMPVAMQWVMIAPLSSHVIDLMTLTATNLSS